MTKHKALMVGGGVLWHDLQEKKMKGEYSLLILKLVMNGLKYPERILSHSICFASIMRPNVTGRAAKTKEKETKSSVASRPYFLTYKRANSPQRPQNQREIIIGPGQPPERRVHTTPFVEQFNGKKWSSRGERCLVCQFKTITSNPEYMSGACRASTQGDSAVKNKPLKSRNQFLGGGGRNITNALARGKKRRGGWGWGGISFFGRGLFEKHIFMQSS